ncbi:MAG: hypothetical protein UT55_C0018G0006 [Candidatus Peregrinibacteria bacterium GW2011_GWE2_39_6]|nr:MAG: hypothetical protein UT36_C0002G0018 [Candidatus Peregrinibacteria bacterium GW2011_GWF2_39_17]KKR26076.1 MAG: hypothetical protein UT55_C0018G0006 [Candidatus Peregrinibacteria bacterium GW2011_GWE2_39_6]
MTTTKSVQEHPAHKGMQSTIIGIFANALLATCKGAAGFFGNSYALIADAIESTSDVVSSIIVLSGLKIASKPRDENHPYGHGKAEPLAAVFVALALIGAAITIAVQSLNEITTRHDAPAPFTLIVLIGVVVIKETLFRFVFRVGHEVQSTAVKTDAWHHRSDAITSAAAFVGISIALIGGPGWEKADDWAALFASAIIIFNAYKLLKPALNEIMDVAPPPHIAEEVRKVAMSVDEVIGLDKCYVRKMGFDYFVDLHVVVNAEITVRHGHAIGHAVKKAICLANPRITDVLIHIEPEDVLKKKP